MWFKRTLSRFALFLALIPASALMPSLSAANACIYIPGQPYYGNLSSGYPPYWNTPGLGQMPVRPLPYSGYYPPYVYQQQAYLNQWSPTIVTPHMISGPGGTFPAGSGAAW